MTPDLDRGIWAERDSEPGVIRLGYLEPQDREDREDEREPSVTLAQIKEVIDGRFNEFRSSFINPEF